MTWNLYHETSKKYADCRFRANIYEIYWDFRSKYIREIYESREMHIRYVQADTLFIRYC